jgi:hypothetical protein
MHRKATPFFLTFFGFLFLGCGGDNMQQPTYPASGMVTLDGRPVKGATIVFHAIDKAKFKWQELPQATSDENGKFSLFTYAANDGAPAAEYKVGIAMLGATDDEGGDQVKRDSSAQKIPAKYADSKTSGITATVNAKSTVIPTFELSSK